MVDTSKRTSWVTDNEITDVCTHTTKVAKFTFNIASGGRSGSQSSIKTCVLSFF